MIAVVVGGFRSLGSRRGLRPRARLALARRARAGAVRVQRAHGRTAALVPEHDRREHGLAGRQPQRRPAVPDRRLVVDEDCRRTTCARNFPAFMTALKSAARRPAQRSHRGRLVGHGRRRRLGQRLRRDGKNGIFQYAPRGACTATGLDRRRDVHLRRQRRPELHRQPRGRVHLHGGAGREWLRLRAPVRADHARARRRRPGAACREPGLPAPRRLPGDRHDHQRGRLLGARRAFRCSTTAANKTIATSWARRRTSAATSSATSATASHPDRHRAERRRQRHEDVRQLRLGRGRRAAARSPTPPRASRRSRPIRTTRSCSRRSRASRALHRALEDARS